MACIPCQQRKARLAAAAQRNTAAKTNKTPVVTHKSGTRSTKSFKFGQS